MKKKTLFLSIGFKLTGIVSLLLGLSLGGLTLLSTWFFSTDIERMLRANTLERVVLLSDTIENDINSYMNSGRLIASTMQGGFLYQRTGTEATNELLSQNQNIKALWIVERNKNGPFVQKKSETPLNISPETLFKTLGNSLDTVFLKESIIYNLSPECNEAMLLIGFPFMPRSETEAESVVLLAITMDPLISALTTRELYTNYIVDSKGTLIAHSDESLVLTRPSLTSKSIVLDSMKGDALLKQMQFTDTEENTYIGSYQRFFGEKLTIVSETRKDTALEGVYIVQKRNILITIIILCTAIFILFFFSKSLTNPIRRLMLGAAKIGEGDFSVKIPRTSRDEIGRLSETFNTMTQGLAERDKIKNAFGKFVNKDIANQILAGDIQLGGETKTAAIFFSDIRSFTAISEKLTPHEVVEFLNDYMTRMVDCVDKTHGVVDKFIGDSIMAIWGVPVSHGNDTENAINGALMMRQALADFNKNRGKINRPIIKIGSGINTGEVIAGQIGSLERMEYTCIGDAVNLASRIESLNKMFRTDILISEHSYSLVRKTFRVEPMKPIRVKGKIEPQQVYAVLGRYDDPFSIKTLDELRTHLGLEKISLDLIDPNFEEEKYEIIE